MAFRHAAWLLGFGAVTLAMQACSDNGSDSFGSDGGASSAGKAGSAGAGAAGVAGSSTGGGGGGGGSDTAGTSNNLAGIGGDTNAGAGGISTPGGAAGSNVGGDSGDAGSAFGGAGGATECGTVVKQEALAPGAHVTECTPVDYATNPPSSGSHYPVWADFGAYDFPLPRGYWVHNMEHGAVVVTYNCTDCDAEIAEAKAWLKTLTTDATCLPGPARIVLVPDPKLNVPWAASSWGYTLKAQCFDAAAFTAFYNAHAGKAPAPETPVCGTGFNFRLDGNTACNSKP